MPHESPHEPDDRLTDEEAKTVLKALEEVEREESDKQTWPLSQKTVT